MKELSEHELTLKIQEASNKLESLQKRKKQKIETRRSKIGQLVEEKLGITNVVDFEHWLSQFDIRKE